MGIKAINFSKKSFIIFSLCLNTLIDAFILDFGPFKRVVQGNPHQRLPRSEGQKCFGRLMHTQEVYSHDAVVVGGGPAGLAAALVLAKNGWNKIVVLEKREAADSYEPELGFTYRIDGRGQKFTDLLQLTSKLKTFGVTTEQIVVTRIQPDGKQVVSGIPAAGSKEKTAYWLPRRQFLRLLHDEIVEKYGDRIQIMFNSVVEAIELSSDASPIKVTAKSQQAEGPFRKEIFTPKLLIGSDGLNSMTRESLNIWWTHEERATGIQTMKPAPFEMQKLSSASAGLRYKVLTLPSGFKLGKHTNATAKPENFYVFLGASKDPKKNIRLGLLPSKNADEPRPANIICKPDHKIWEIKEEEHFFSFLEEMFPQIDVKELLSEDQARLFVHGKTGRFCEAQYCSKIAQSFNTSGVILLGDAIHAFPPDLGQGVTSALEDVVRLDEILGSTSASNISLIVDSYQKAGASEAYAIAKLVQLGFPFQYRQSKIGLFFWSANFLLRKLLNQFLPRFFSPQIFAAIIEHQLSYHEILHQVNLTSKRIFGCAFVVVGTLLSLLVKSILSLKY